MDRKPRRGILKFLILLSIFLATVSVLAEKNEIALGNRCRLTHVGPRC